jgi:putative pyruvate formate lyase activating enzyme
MSVFSPSYLTAYKNGELIEKANKANGSLRNCNLCPRRCHVDRTKDDLGVCKTGRLSKVASYNAHFGEEAPLVGQNGSGTIFFSHCNLCCNFCQNYDISHRGWGEEVTSEQLAEIMLNLQSMGCHNINLVTPSHVVPQIMSALILAIENGLNLPLVYNTSGYDCVNTLKLLDGLIDIYMPDFKFWNSYATKLTCDVEDYPQIAKKAILEMHRQVGDLDIEKDGIARKGVLVRHLVMPENLAGTRNVMEFIVKEISSNTYVNIMSQYRPCGRAVSMQELNTIVGPEEFRQALKEATAVGITRIDGRHLNFQI